MDRRHGKRPLPSDHASREEREGFNFSVLPSPPKSQGEEASQFSFIHPINNTSDDSTPSTPIPQYGQISNSCLIETQDPSLQPLNQGKIARFMHYLTFFSFNLYYHLCYIIQPYLSIISFRINFLISPLFF